MERLAELLTEEDVMKYFGINDKRTLREYMKNGLHYIQLGRKRRFTIDQVDNFLKSKSTSLI